MKERIYKLWSIDLLLKTKKYLEFQVSNWERRVREQTEHYNPILRSVAEYRKRIKKCKKELGLIDAELKRRKVE